MSTAPEERLRDHWWWRPGTRPGRRQYVWHVLFDDQPQVAELVGRCQERLRALGGLDPVPATWLHMTTQVVGFVDEVGATEVGAMLDAVGERMRRLEPADLRLGRLLFFDEGLALGVDRREPLDAVRAGIRDSVAARVERHLLAADPDWTPHVSVVYSNSDGPMAPLRAAMRPPPEPVPVRIGAVHLVGQVRDGHTYVWEPIAEVPLGSA